MILNILKFDDLDDMLDMKEFMKKRLDRLEEECGDKAVQIAIEEDDTFTLKILIQRCNELQ